MAHTPTLFFFRSDHNDDCSTQWHHLDQLQAAWPSQLTIEAFDIDQESSDLLNGMPITIPATVLVDVNGSVRAINNGLISAQDLRKQLEEIVIKIR